nr:MAG TPA: hypothetical protein [Caudoviricetes sp.]
MFATSCTTACNQRTDVRFNTLKVFYLIEYFSKLKYIEKSQLD